MALEDLPLDEFQRGAKACLVECKFMPRPCEIRERSKLVKLSLCASVEWERVVKTMRSKGRAKFPMGEFSPTTQRAIRLAGGVNAIADMTNETEPFVRKRFEADFADTQEQADREERNALHAPSNVVPLRLAP